MERSEPRSEPWHWPGLLASTIFHVVVAALLIDRPLGRRFDLLPVEPTPEPRQRVFVPSPEELKQAISFGSKERGRTDRPVLRRDDDLLGRLRRGTGEPRPEARARDAAPPAPATGESPAPPRVATAPAFAPPPAGQPGLTMPPAPARETVPLPRGQGTIAASLRDLETRLAQGPPPRAQAGAPIERTVGALHFDPQGADFTNWVRHWTNEVYRNWIPPQAALFGARGECEFEFTVERDGRVSDVTLLRSSGTPSLDRAARNALLGGRLLELPADFRPERMTARAVFIYGDAPAHES